MTYKTILHTCMLFVFVPIWIGIIWISFLRIKSRLECLLNAWILGLVTMFAVGQIILVPMIALGQTLTSAVMVFKLVLTVLGTVSFFVILKWAAPLFGQASLQVPEQEKKDDENMPKGFAVPSSRRVFCAVFGVLAAVLIVMQAFILSYYQHIDDDDSRFIAEEVSAVVHDTMFVDDPITVDFMYWNLGEVRKDLTSPWTMYVAICCRIADAAPAVFSHTVFPFFMIMICYVVYAMIGRVLLRGDMEKVFLFLIFISVLHIWDYTSTHTLGSMILLRIWQGKAIVAGFIIPVLLYLFYQILRQKKHGRYIAALYPVSFAGSLMSGIGIVVVPVLLAVYGFIELLHGKNFRRTLAIWLAAVPCGIYLGYYLAGIM